MIKSQYTHALDNKSSIIRLQNIALIGLFCLCVLSAIGWMNAPSNLRIHIPPDLTNGASLNQGEIHKSNIYTFAYYIFQQLNRWETDGKEDYDRNIHMLQHYLTPACHQNRIDDSAERQNNHELDRRQRSIAEIPGRVFSPGRVARLDANAWVVSLDVELRETMLGETVKQRFVNYPIRVVRYDIDPEQNPWGLALDCFAGTPRLIETETFEQDDA
jgi:integrating conjugative element protein (TIGR03746 family)